MAALRRALSAPRLDAYRDHPGEAAASVLGRYRWNVALCAALYPPLHHLEIALRNSLNHALRDLYKTDLWYDMPRVLAASEQKAVEEAQNALRDDRKPVVPDRVVAELKFGFWTGLLSSRYERKLWPTLLRPAFPGALNRERTLHNMAGRFNAIRRLRNRVFHHEPICMKGNLLQRYTDILEAIRWLEPEVARLLPIGEDFGEVYNRGHVGYVVRVVSD